MSRGPDRSAAEDAEARRGRDLTGEGDLQSAELAARQAVDEDVEVALEGGAEELGGALREDAIGDEIVERRRR